MSRPISLLINAREGKALAFCAECASLLPGIGRIWLPLADCVNGTCARCGAVWARGEGADGDSM